MTIMPLFMRDPWLEACWPPLAALLPRSRKHSNVKENTRQASKETEEEGWDSLLALWWGAHHTTPAVSLPRNRSISRFPNKQMSATSLAQAQHQHHHNNNIVFFPKQVGVG